MKNRVDISIIVPIYKVEEYLDRCVRSIAEQTYGDLEIILVDDGSPDGCPAICDAWAEKDARIKVIHKENGGLSDARNAGMAIATGAYVAFIDSDDSIKPDFIQKLYGAITEYNADVAECAVSYVDESGNTLRERNSAPMAEMGKIEALRRLVLEDGVYQTVWNKLYRREVVADIPFAIGKYHEDEFWTYQVFDRIEKLAVVRDSLYNYLQRGSSIIGVGYNIRRLDGLEARFLRMKHLQKYDELAELTKERIVSDYAWHLSNALSVLEGDERQTAVDIILDYLRLTDKVPMHRLSGSIKHRALYLMFRISPILTAKLMNIIILRA